MSWICRYCETANTDNVLECEVCGTSRTVNLQTSYYVEISLCIDCLQEMCNSFVISCENILKLWKYIYFHAERKGKNIKKFAIYNKY